MATAEIVHIPQSHTEVVRAEDFMPVFTVQQAVEKKRMLNQFINDVLIEEATPGAGGDYGKLPGMPKKILLKPGAEKLCSIFGFSPRYSSVQVIEDWTGKDHAGEPLFYYEYKCELYRGERFMGESIGSCNSWESKYRYRWITAEQAQAQCIATEGLPSKGGRRTLFEFQFALEKRETTGQYGKPAEHWDAFEKAIHERKARTVEKKTKNGNKPGFEIDVDTTLYRIPNPDVADAVNTCQKMAQKRALVAVVLVVTNCSDAFTQDIEDQMDTTGIDTGGNAVGTQAAQDYVRDKKLAEAQGVADPALAKLLDRIRVADPLVRQTVLVEVCEAIREAHGDRAADEAWTRATNLHGDPAMKPAACDNVLRYLYNTLKVSAA